jgi:hypothetical protein
MISFPPKSATAAASTAASPVIPDSTYFLLICVFSIILFMALLACVISFMITMTINILESGKENP